MGRPGPDTAVPTRRHPLIAREGWGHVGVAVLVAGLVHAWAGAAWALPLWLGVAFVVQFFRDPPRRIPVQAGAVVAPADGKVVALGPAEDPYLKRPAQRVSIFMNVFSVHSNRIPVAGEIVQRWYHAGRFLNAALDKASAENERNAIWIKSAHGEDVVSVQVAGLIARRILCYVSAGDQVERGERYGFIRFGSRVDVYLPEQAVTSVHLGKWVSAGESVIATLVPPAR